MISVTEQTAPVVAGEEIIVIEGADGHAAVGSAPLGGPAAPVVHHETLLEHEQQTVGMPQLDPSSYGNQIFWLLVSLAVLYWVLAKIALPRIGSVLADRQGAVTGDLMAAEDYKRRAHDAEAAYDAALAEARAEAGKIVEANRAEMQKEIDKATAHADAEIAARAAESEKRIGEIRASARDDARRVAKDITAEIVRHFGGEADQATVDAAVEQNLKGAM